MSIANRGITGAGAGLLASVAVTVVASFLPWYSITIFGLTASANAWNSWWWLPIIVAVGVGILYLLEALGSLDMSRAAGGRALPIASLVSFVLTLIVLIYILARGTSALKIGDSGTMTGGDTIASAGPSLGIFLALLATAAMTYFAAMVSRHGARMPFVRG